MTDEQTRVRLFNLLDSFAIDGAARPDLQTAILRFLSDAVAAERERCAKVAGGLAKEWGERWKAGEKTDRLAGFSDGASVVERCIRNDLAIRSTAPEGGEG